MQKNLILIVLAFFLLNLFNWVFWGEFVFGFPSIAKYILSASSVGIIIYYRFTHATKPFLGELFYPVMFVFVGWSVVLLISVVLNPQSELWPTLSFMQRILGQPNFFLPYLLPLLLLFAKFDTDFFVILFRYAYILIILGILIELITIFTGISSGNKEQQNRVLIFNLAGSFLLVTAHMSKKKYVFYVVLVYTLLFMFMLAQWGRRAMLIDTVLVVLAMIVMRLKTRFLNFNDRLKIYFAGILLLIIVLQFGNIAKSSYVFQRGFTMEAHEETRGFVYEAFFQDFSSASDWVLGRGLGGAISRDVRTDRLVDFVESGFLTLLFKGGLLYLIPFIILLFRAIYLGLYRSNNDLVKALGLLLLIHLVSMYAWNWPEITSKYVFMWVSVSACFNAELRRANNEEVFMKMNLL